MLDSIQSLLDALPEGVVQIRGGLVQACSGKARQYLPQLAVGKPVPNQLALSGEDGGGAGEFSLEGAVYSYSCSAAGDELLVLIRPVSEGILTGRQLEGVAYQLRTLLGDMLAEVGPSTAEEGGPVPAAAFGKTFHRLFRLLDNLELLQDAVPFHPVTMDLAGLCRDVVRPAADLLREAGVSLEYRSAESGLLIPGDPALLEKLLLELIANAARASEGGGVVLGLRRQGGRAVLTVSHSGPPAVGPQLDALLRPGVGEEAPLPGQGAGLGLSAARRIVALHKGSLLMEWGRSAPGAVVSLPTGPLDGKAKVRTPAYQRDGGLDPVLMALSDLLPARIFGLEGLD